MKNSTSKIMLSGLISALTGSLSAGNMVVTTLPYVDCFPEIEKFGHLPCPLNLLSVSRSLAEKGHLQKLYQKLSRDQKLPICQMERYAALPYPNNVLHCMVEEIRRCKPNLDQFIDILHADPTLITTPFDFKKAEGQTTVILEAFKYNAQIFLRQMLEIGFNPTSYYHIQSYMQRIRQRYAALARKEHPRSYETIMQYANGREKKPEWLKKLDSAAHEKPLILRVEEKQAKTIAATPYVGNFSPWKTADDEKTAEDEIQATQLWEQRPQVRDIFAEMDMAQVAGAINREYRLRAQRDESLLSGLRSWLVDNLSPIVSIQPAVPNLLE